MKFTYLFISLFPVLLFACQQRDRKLEEALRMAGDNREELEKVLVHYSRHPGDSLKLKAAEFLIVNMPGHYTLRGDSVDSYRKKCKESRNKSFQRKILGTDNMISDVSNDSITYFDSKIFDILSSHAEDMELDTWKEEDIECVEADYLIRHIDASFKLLHTYPWLQDLPMNLFFEYLLPYRLDHEVIDMWRDSIQISPAIDDFISYYDKIKYDLFQVSRLIEYEKHGLVFNRDFIGQFLNIDFQTNCYESYISSVFRLRALGIPAALDYIPFHPDRNGHHYWCTIISPNIRNGDKNLFSMNRAAKIYRFTYARHQESVSLREEFIPELFRNPFIEDVTPVYLNTTDVYVKTRKKLPRKPVYGYLSVFNNLSWEPIGRGKFKNDGVRFEDMGKNILYLPVYYTGNIEHAFNYPFILDSRGKVTYLIPDRQKSEHLILTRKYPFNKTLYTYCKDLDGVVIESSNDRKFVNKDTLVVFRPVKMEYISHETAGSRPGRYYRIQGNGKRVLYLAELKFFDKEGNVLEGRYESDYRNAFDNDPLTNISIYDEDFVIDFEKPTEVAKVVCVPRGDGNGIYPGDKYELFYYESDGWRSIGSQKATDYYIEFAGVPAGALLWLRNLTTGVEERPFTVQQGKIRFW